MQQYLGNEINVSNQVKQAWVEHWMNVGFKAVEAQLEETAGLYCFDDSVSVADICLVAQVYNAHRFKVDMTAFPLINKVVSNCNKLPAFIKAAPENQADAQ